MARLLQPVAQSRQRRPEAIRELRVLVGEIVLLGLEVGETQVVMRPHRVGIERQCVLIALDGFVIALYPVQVDAARNEVPGFFGLTAIALSKMTSSAQFCALCSVQS